MTTIAEAVARAPLRRGDKGDAVKAVQIALRGFGHELVADGDFGSITKAAVQDFQASTPQSGRHGFATTILRSGVDPKTGAWLGGWKSIKHFMET